MEEKEDLKEANKQNTKTIITAPKEAKYLSDIKDFKFPVNCLFNKGKTGCGGTEMVLGDKRNTIIAVPYISLIKNKIEKNSEHGDRSNKILGFYGAVDKSSVKSYIESHPIKKIIVTYDSLPKLVGIIQGINGNEEDVFNDYFLLVDEWHCLFNYYDFRGEAIRGLLSVSPRFKEVTYMTATPVSDYLKPEKLKNLQVVEIEWEDKKKLQAHLLGTNNIYALTAQTIERIINENKNAHIFLNSVKMITQLLNSQQYAPDEVRIVCADRNENLNKLKSVNEGYKIEKPTSPVKKINLYTSTAFEGCDIFDEEGVNIIITNAHEPHTILDIETTVRQVCGRIRNSKHKDSFYFIYTSQNKPIDEKAERKYLKSRNAEYAADKELYEDLNKLNEKSRKRLLGLLKITRANNSLPKYLIVNDKSEFFIDKTLYDIENYKHICLNVYFINNDYVEARCKACGIEVLANEHVDFKPAVDMEKLKESIEKEQKNISREKIFEAYHTSRMEKKSTALAFGEETMISIIENRHPDIRGIYDTLGIDKIRELEYDKQKINVEMKKRENTPNEIKFVELFMNRIELGKTYSNDDITQIIGQISTTYELPEITKARLKTYFDWEKAWPKINGKTARGVKFIHKKNLPF